MIPTPGWSTKNRPPFTVTLMAFVLLTSNICLGAEIVDKPKTAVEEGKKPGFQPMLKGAAKLAVGHSKNVTGTTDGTTLNFGYLINSALNYRNETLAHEWQNTLTLQLGYTRTPSIDTLCTGGT